MDSFPPWVAKVRNDPLGAAGYSRLAIERYRWNEETYVKEHLLVAGASAGAIGEHNAPEVPREVGSVELVGGPAYTNHNFRYATSCTRTALGTATLNLNSAPYANVSSMAVQVQNCSESGINKPCLTGHLISSTSAIVFYNEYLSSALGAGQTWAPEDTNFCVAIHGPPLGSGARAGLGPGKQRGDFLTDYNTDHNLNLAAELALRSAYLVEHDSAGEHINREVARTWASVGVRSGGGVYDLLDTSARLPLTVSRPGAGICRLTTATAWSLDAQPFVTPDFQRLNGGVEEDIYVSVTPRSLITTTTIDVYLYKYTPGSPGTWARADTDFFVAVYAGQ